MQKSGWGERCGSDTLKATSVEVKSCSLLYSHSSYSNIFVTSPSPENLRTLFDFVLRGFDKLDYVEHEHYNIVQSTQEEFHKAIVRINIFQRHRQTIQVRRLQSVFETGSINSIMLTMKSNYNWVNSTCMITRRAGRYWIITGDIFP